MKFKPIIRTEETGPVGEVDGQLVVDIIDRSISVDYNKERIRVGMDSDADSQIESINNIFANFKERMNYSLEEVNTGRKWVEGSYIYRKTFMTHIMHDVKNHPLGSVEELFGIPKILAVGNNFGIMFFPCTSVSQTMDSIATPLTINIDHNNILNVSVLSTIVPVTSGSMWYFTIEYIKLPRLEDVSWAEIKQISDAGNARKYWDVGDAKTIKLSNDDEITLEIWGFNHDDRAAGGKAGITFGMRDLMATTQRMNPTATNIGGWYESEMRTVFLPDILTRFPEDLQSVIANVVKTATIGGGTSEEPQETQVKSEDKLFLFSGWEVWGRGVFFLPKEGEQYEYWRTIRNGNILNDRIKRLANGVGDADWWWFRSPVSVQDISFTVISYIGGISMANALRSHGVCFGFCV